MNDKTPQFTQYDLLLKGGHLIDPHNRVDAVRDVAIQGNQIAAVAHDINPALAANVVDVSGHIVPRAFSTFMSMSITHARRKATLKD